MAGRTRNPRVDLNVLAKSIVDRATGEAPPKAEPQKDPAAVELGRRGGKARAAKFSAEKRSAVAKKAALARRQRP